MRLASHNNHRSHNNTKSHENHKNYKTITKITETSTRSTESPNHQKTHTQLRKTHTNEQNTQKHAKCTRAADPSRGLQSQSIEATTPSVELTTDASVKNILENSKKHKNLQKKKEKRPSSETLCAWCNILYTKWRRTYMSHEGLLAQAVVLPVEGHRNFFPAKQTPFGRHLVNPKRQRLSIPGAPS